jgi:hypothetical protein
VVFYESSFLSYTSNAGVSEQTIMHHLDDLGIRSIDLNYHLSKKIDQFENKFRYKGTLNIDHTDTVDRIIYDVFLVIVP